MAGLPVHEREKSTQGGLKLVAVGVLIGAVDVLVGGFLNNIRLRINLNWKRNLPRTAYSQRRSGHTLHIPIQT